MFLIDQMRQMPPIYVAMTVLFILGLCCLGLGLTYEDCSLMHTISFDETHNCADSWLELSLAPFGLIILGIDLVLPSIINSLGQVEKFEIIKIDE